MVGGLQELVTGQQIASWLIIAFLVVYFVYKEFPDFRKRLSKSAVKEKEEEISDKSIAERLDNIEKAMKEMNEKLSRDYDRINVLERDYKKTENILKNSLEESGIIMRALLGIIEGLQELGANGKTKESEDEIQKYLIRQAHDGNVLYPVE